MQNYSSCLCRKFKILYLGEEIPFNLVAKLKYSKGATKAEKGQYKRVIYIIYNT